jgi:glycerophosphoryl diester phosphodiesterase
LREVFELLKPTALTANIELKTTERLYPELPEKLLALASEYAMADRALYSSFNLYSLMEIKKISPQAKIGLLYELAMVDPWVYANYVKADAIHPYYYVIAALPETVGRCHENGVLVNVWTVDDPEAIKQMLKCGVDGIITNRPDIAAAIRGA